MSHVLLLFKKSAYYLVFLQKALPNAKIGFSKAMSVGWLEVNKGAEGGPRIRRKVGCQRALDL